MKEKPNVEAFLIKRGIPEAYVQVGLIALRNALEKEVKK